MHDIEWRQMILQKKEEAERQERRFRIRAAVALYQAHRLDQDKKGTELREAAVMQLSAYRREYVPSRSILQRDKIERHRIQKRYLRLKKKAVKRRLEPPGDTTSVFLRVNPDPRSRTELDIFKTMFGSKEKGAAMARNRVYAEIGHQRAECRNPCQSRGRNRRSNY